MFVAHRGGAGLAPENTMDAFRSAVERWDADMLEMDVRATRDGRIVVIHDPTVDRTTDGTGAIAEMTWAQLSEVDAGYGFRDADGTRSFAGKGVHIPLLDEVLETFPNVRINVETKVAAAARGVVEAVRRHGAERRVLVAAEREAWRRDARGYHGPWGASRTQLWRFWMTHRVPGMRGYTPRADIFQIPDVRWGHTFPTRAFVAAAQRRNIPVHVWVVNEESRMHELLDIGVDGIQTDRPDRLDRVFRARGLR